MDCSSFRSLTSLRAVTLTPCALSGGEGSGLNLMCSMFDWRNVVKRMV